MKILSIVGARPQFIKAAPLSLEFGRINGVEEIMIHTGQHFDANMSEVFFDELNMPKPQYNLNINSMSHGKMTARMLEKIEEIIVAEDPNWVVVFGDTNSTLAGALAASKLNKKIAHIEAGLRSFNTKMPEEINRIVTDRISNLLFCPTEAAVNNLKNEGFSAMDCNFENVGDIMLDSTLLFKQFAKNPFKKKPEKYILSTIHRAENTNDLSRLKSIFEALNDISNDLPVVIPLHPRTKKIVEENDIMVSNKLSIIEPVGYLEMIFLISNSELVMTDSGGMQKEAYFHKKPCITLRDETEWVELVEKGFNFICGSEKNRIIDTFQMIKSKKVMFIPGLYGDGKTAEKIVNRIIG